jgi:hypothetical protein
MRWQLLAMAVLALSLRIALCALATGTTGTRFSDYAKAADGYQFLAYAHAWRGDMAELAAHPYYRRLFPGYPALIAALESLGVPESAAALLPSWLAAPAVAILCVFAFGDRRVGWAMAALTPAYIFSGSLISTEALCLLLSLAGILLAERGRAGPAGVAFGLAGLFRPVAVFAMLGAAAREVIAGRPRAAAGLVATAGATVAAGLVAVRWHFGDTLMSVHEYASDTGTFRGELFTWPFKSLITTPFTTSVAAWKLAYVGVHVLVVLAACTLAVREWRRAADVQQRGLAALATVWLIGNTLFVLSVGYVWGFHDFARFTIPALPALFWICRGLLPRRSAVWLAIGLVGVGLSLAPAKRRLEQPPPDAATSKHGTSSW